MRKFYLLIVMGFLGLRFQAQVAYFETRTCIDSLANPQSPTYGIKLSFPGMNKPLLYVLKDTTANITYYGDSIGGLPASAYNHVFMGFALNAGNIVDTIGKTMLIPAHKIFHLYSQVFNTINNCAPQLVIDIDTTVEFNFPASGGYFIGGRNSYNIGMMNFSIDFTQSTHASLSNAVCPGKYTIYALPQDSLNYQVQETHIFIVGDYDAILSPDTSLHVTAYPFVNTTGALCNGKALTSVYGSTPPYHYSYDGGPYIDSAIVTNLCAGPHTVVVATAADTVGAYFVISADTNSYSNSNPYGPVVDTIVYNYSNCNFDYSQQVDSAYITNAFATDSNSFFITWNIWQNGVMTVVSDTLSYAYVPGNNMITLVMYCGSAKAVLNFNSKSFTDFTNLHYNGIPTGIKDAEAGDAKVYPNPFSERLLVAFPGKITKVELSDLLGQPVSVRSEATQQGVEFQAASLKPGFYFVRVFTGDQSHVFKVLKQ